MSEVDQFGVVVRLVFVPATAATTAAAFRRHVADRRRCLWLSFCAARALLVDGIDVVGYRRGWTSRTVR